MENSFIVLDNSGNGSVVRRDFTRETRKTASEFYIEAPGTGSGIEVAVKDGDKNVFSVLTTEKGFAYKTNNQGAKEFYTRMPSVAYNFSVRTDYDKHTADLYMNNRIMEKNIPIASDITGVELRLNLLDAGSRQEKMNLIISSGETFDIMMTDPTGPLSLAVNSRRNAFLDLTDLREQGYICSI